MKNIIAFFLLFTLFAFAHFELEAKELNLSDIIKKGLMNNYRIRISRENVKISTNNNSWGLAGRYPSIDLSLKSVNSINNIPSQNLPDQRTEYKSYMLSPNININWTLFRGFSVSITKKKLNMLNKISVKNKEIVVENTIQAIILSYYKVILEGRKLRVLKKLRDISRDRYRYLKLKKEYGSAITSEVLYAKIAFLSDNANIIGQKMNLKNARRNLNLVLGENINKNISIEDKLEFKDENFQFTQLRKKLFSNNKSLINQYINQEILKNEIRLNKSGYYPTVALNSGITMNNNNIKYSNIPLNSSSSYNYYVNFSINMNLFKGGNTRRKIINSRVNEKIGKIKLSELKFTLENRLTGLIDLYNLRKELLKISEESVKSSSLNLEISNKRFKAGAINSFNFRDIQLIYLNTIFGKLQAMYNLIDTSTEILRLTGELTIKYIK